MNHDDLLPEWEPVAVHHDAGVSYRQLDYWARRGWLNPDRRHDAELVGSGNPRIWTDQERRVARIMGRLVAAGLTPEVAAGIARQAAAAPADDPLSVVTVTPSVTVMVANE